MRVDCDTCVCVVCGGSLVVITLVSGGVSVSLSVPWWAGVTVYREGHGVRCTQPTASPGHTSASDSVRCRHYHRDWRPGGEKGDGVSLKNRVRQLWWSLDGLVSMWSIVFTDQGVQGHSSCCLVSALCEKHKKWKIETQCWIYVLWRNVT